MQRLSRTSIFVLTAIAGLGSQASNLPPALLAKVRAAYTSAAN